MSDEDDIIISMLTKYTDYENAVTVMSKSVDASPFNYKQILYQILFELKLGEKNLSKIMTELDKGNVLWNHECFTKEHTNLLEQDDFIENPFEIAEGVIQCNCGSRRVFTFSKQVRSGDEGYTTFAECMACKSKWSYKG